MSRARYVVATKAPAEGPFYFGPADRARFGVRHRADPAPSKGAAALVICPHLGAENIPAHRGVLKLAAAAAAGGTEVLRYDPFAHGDSAGEPGEARLADWLEDVALARQALPPAEVDLVAIGLSTLVVARALAKATPVRSLVLWDPPRSGRDWRVAAFERRKVVEAATSCRFAEPGPGGATDIVGFSLSAAALDEIADLSLADLPRGAAARALIVSTAEVPPDAATTALVRERVGAIESVHQPLPAGLQDDPFRPRVPLNAVQAILDFLARAAP